MEDGEVATCAVADVDVLYSSRKLADYEEVLEEWRSLDCVPLTPEVTVTAVIFNTSSPSEVNIVCRFRTSSSLQRRWGADSLFCTTTRTLTAAQSWGYDSWASPSATQAFSSSDPQNGAPSDSARDRTSSVDAPLLSPA